MTDRASFSERFGFRPPPKEITVREDAPEDFRYAVVALAAKHGLTPHGMRSDVCNALMVRPNPGNWSAYPNVYDEVMDRVDECDWYRVYDIAEAFHQDLYECDPAKANAYEIDLNRYVEEHGIGWMMSGGSFLARGSEAFISTVTGAEKELRAQARATAATEIHEALMDISRRPEADRTGAIQHAVAALECLLKDLAGKPKKTLGEILKVDREQLGIPAPLDQAVEKLWGYASESGRHLREGRAPSFEEAQLIVTVSAALCSYLSKLADASTARMSSDVERP